MKSSTASEMNYDAWVMIRRLAGGADCLAASRAVPEASAMSENFS